MDSPHFRQRSPRCLHHQHNRTGIVADLRKLHWTLGPQHAHQHPAQPLRTGNRITGKKRLGSMDSRGSRGHRHRSYGRNGHRLYRELPPAIARAYESLDTALTICSSSCVTSHTHTCFIPEKPLFSTSMIRTTRQPPKHSSSRNRGKPCAAILTTNAIRASSRNSSIRPDTQLYGAMQSAIRTSESRDPQRKKLSTESFSEPH